MITGRMKHHQPLLVSTSIFFLLCSTILPPAANARASRKKPDEPRVAESTKPRGVNSTKPRVVGYKKSRVIYPRPGHHVKALTWGHRTVKVGPRNYFFLKGVFYQNGSGGYVVVAAPIGARILSLPAASISLTIGTITYWTYAGVYYQKVPDGYLVVTQPVQPAAPDAAIAWEGDQVRVQAAFLNVRSGPGKEHPVVSVVNQGDLLVVRSSSSDWYYAKLADNSFGWVMVNYTVMVEPKPMG